MSEYSPMVHAQAGRGRGRQIEFSDGIRNAAIRASKGSCFYCLTTLVGDFIDVDHLIPASKGGR